MAGRVADAAWKPAGFHGWDVPQVPSLTPLAARLPLPILPAYGYLPYLHEWELLAAAAMLA